MRNNDCSVCSTCHIKTRSICSGSHCSLSIDIDIVVCNSAVSVHNTQISTKVELVFHILTLVTCRSHRCLDSMIVIEDVRRELLYIRLITTGISHIEVEFTCLVRFKTHHCDIILERSEYCTLIPYTFHMILHIACCSIHIKIANIALCINSIRSLCTFHIIETLSREAKQDNTCCTITCSMRALRHPVRNCKILYRSIIFIEDALLYFSEYSKSICIIVRVRSLVPECIFVELERIACDTTGVHNTKTTVSQR